MTIINQVPTTPQPWNKNPEGYVKHQQLLIQLIEWLEFQGAEVVLPEDTGKPDNGVDLIVNGLRVDLKSFGLDLHNKSLTWRSTYYRGRPAPLYDTLETDWFVHPTTGPVSEWTAYTRDSLRTSKYGYAPYVFATDTITLEQFSAT